MELIDINFLYKSGAIAKTIEDKDVFLLARPNPQRGDGHLLMLIEQSDLISQIASKIPIPPALPYKVYTALLTQSGTNAPTVTVLQNTIGNIVWTYGGTGYVNGTLLGAFPVDKTWTSVDAVQNASAGTYGTCEVIVDTDIIQLNTVEIATNNPVNNQLVKTALEIRVYP